jgi:hypothetical protein
MSLLGLFSHLVVGFRDCSSDLGLALGRGFGSESRRCAVRCGIVYDFLG